MFLCTSFKTSSQRGLPYGASGGAANLQTNATPYTGLESDGYWSSSEDDADVAWSFYSGNGNWDDAFMYIVVLVRACLAF